ADVQVRAFLPLAGLHIEPEGLAHVGFCAVPTPSTDDIEVVVHLGVAEGTREDRHRRRLADPTVGCDVVDVHPVAVSEMGLEDRIAAHEVDPAGPLPDRSSPHIARERSTFAPGVVLDVVYEVSVGATC